MKGKLSLFSFRLKNFKAVQDSKTIMFTPLTVFIGNNGSGKSSIFEGLETLQTLALHGLDAAMLPWHVEKSLYPRLLKHARKPYIHTSVFQIVRTLQELNRRIHSPFLPKAGVHGMG
ncbi:MAG: AAA family ATPase [Deltaproteobacteria bacterium]|nr:AAA family ATPase [Deltaproteobacteria bacterium]